MVQIFSWRLPTRLGFEEDDIGQIGPSLMIKHTVDEGGEKEAVIMIRLEANNGSLKTVGKR